MEFALELILELYGDLLFEFLPQKAKGTKKACVLARILAFFMVLIVAALLIWGFVLLSQEANVLGLVPLCAGLLIAVAHVVFVIKRNK